MSDIVIPTAMLEVGVGALFAMLGVPVLILGLSNLRGWLAVRDTAAVAPSAVSAGVVEVTGTARPLDRTLASPRSVDDAECLVYDYEIEERTGNKHDTLHSESGSVPFLVEGEHESLVVDPTNAGLLLDANVDKKEGGRQIRLERLDPGDDVYVTGRAVASYETDVETGGHEFLVRDSGSLVPSPLDTLVPTPFYVADAGEAAAERRLKERALVPLGFGLFMILVGGYATVTLAMENGLFGL